MSSTSTTIDELIQLSRWLGAPEQDCAILGEGNTSARVDDWTFLVKASGYELQTLDQTGLVKMDFARTAALMLDETLTDDSLGEALIAARVDANDTLRPSVEVTLHGVCLELPGVQFVGHTHPTAINAMTCSIGFEQALRDRLFPDEIVVCGVEPLLIPYIDPGLELARVVKSSLEDYLQRTGQAPKCIYLQNHGFIALGASAAEVKAITAMAVKTARIRLGTEAYGGANPLRSNMVDRIDNRPDEDYRRKQLNLGTKNG